MNVMAINIILMNVTRLNAFLLNATLYYDVQIFPIHEKVPFRFNSSSATRNRTAATCSDAKLSFY
jgi:hypothetical protein